MAVKVIMPQGGQDIVTGRVVKWLKSEGETVARGEVICEVETEKAVFEVEAPDDGVLLRIVIRDGQETAIFGVIGYVGAPGEVIPAEESSPEHATRIPEAHGPDRLEGISARDRGRKVPISPRARRLADELGLDVNLVTGTGPGGRITEKDVQGFHSERALGVSGGRPEGIVGGRVAAMSRLRRLTARRMQLSNQTIPHFYVTVGVDVTEAQRFRTEANERVQGQAGISLTLTDLVARACVLGFQEFPEFNCSVQDDENLILWENLNFGIAVAVGNELLVPVIPDIDRLSLAEIAVERARLVSKAQQGKLSSLASSRFTISNLGMYNVDQFIAIINPPETAILAVASIIKQFRVLKSGEVGIRDSVNLSLSVDHRAADGVLASRFLNAVRSALEAPESLAG
jgi:pyruvate dehydrogenase E2 component (dihydrolipoamide acetyltransferase)